jgi:hypothetical protein
VYQAVADRLLELVHGARDHGSPEDCRAANLWLRILDNKCVSLRWLVKPAVMVKPYGGTVSGNRDKVEAFWEEVDGEDDWLDVLRHDEGEVSKLHHWLAARSLRP